MEVKELINLNLDIHFIGQQLDHGLLKGARYINFIAQLFKIYCAPAREPEVDKMLILYEIGKTIKVFEIAFDILEMMNFQLYQLTPKIIEDAFLFEAKYFKSEIQNKHISLKHTITWLSNAFKNEKEKSKEIINIYPKALLFGPRKK